MSERVLIVGPAGGREAAMGHTLLHGGVPEIAFLGGNAGTTDYGINITDVDPTDPHGVVSVADTFAPDLVIIGPEAPLVHGVGDALRNSGMLVFGPNEQGARLEGSKAYATRFMERHGIPHPRSHTTTNLTQATRSDLYRSYADGSPGFVIKQDGLHAGKGVIVPATMPEADNTLFTLFSSPAGNQESVEIQEKLHGPEVSMFVILDGTGDYRILPFSQDHKRAYDGDTGPNTGGMGAYAPVPSSIVSPAQAAKLEQIAYKAASGLRHESEHGYQGVLYVNTMLAEEYDGDPQVIEFNARFGDPEAEVLLPLLAENGGDIYGMMRTVAEGKLDHMTIPSYIAGTALSVCLTGKDYPERGSYGALIQGLNSRHPGYVFHGGTRFIDPQAKIIATNGGRILHTVGVAPTIQEAAQQAYAMASEITFTDPETGEQVGPHYRTDIGHQAMGDS